MKLKTQLHDNIQSYSLCRWCLKKRKGLEENQYFQGEQITNLVVSLISHGKRHLRQVAFLLVAILDANYPDAEFFPNLCKKKVQ